MHLRKKLLHFLPITLISLHQHYVVLHIAQWCSHLMRHCWCNVVHECKPQFILFECLHLLHHLFCIISQVDSFRWLLFVFHFLHSDTYKIKICHLVFFFFQVDETFDKFGSFRLNLKDFWIFNNFWCILHFLRCLLLVWDFV